MDVLSVLKEVMTLLETADRLFSFLALKEKTLTLPDTWILHYCQMLRLILRKLVYLV